MNKILLITLLALAAGIACVDAQTADDDKCLADVEKEITAWSNKNGYTPTIGAMVLAHAGPIAIPKLAAATGWPTGAAGLTKATKCFQDLGAAALNIKAGASTAEQESAMTGAFILSNQAGGCATGTMAQIRAWVLIVTDQLLLSKQTVGAGLFSYSLKEDFSVVGKTGGNITMKQACKQEDALVCKIKITGDESSNAYQRACYGFGDCDKPKAERATEGYLCLQYSCRKATPGGDMDVNCPWPAWLYACIVIGVLLIVGIIALVVVCCCKRKKGASSTVPKPSPAPTATEPAPVSVVQA
jgi:hypothetical protein